MKAHGAADSDREAGTLSAGAGSPRAELPGGNSERNTTRLDTTKLEASALSSDTAGATKGGQEAGVALLNPTNAAVSGHDGQCAVAGLAGASAHGGSQVASKNSGADTAATAASAPPLAEQLAPAIMRLSAADGARHISLELAPKDLGRVEISIVQPADGGTTVSLTVERPDTLARLQRDHDQLSQALDRAGLPGENRVVTFHLAAPQPIAAATHDARPTSPADGGATAGAGPNSFDGNPSGRSASEGGGQRQRRLPAALSMGPGGDDPGWTQIVDVTAPRSWRVGLNITA